MATEVFIVLATRQPTIQRANTSITKATYSQPCQVEPLEEILKGERSCSDCRHTYSAYFQMFQGEYSQAPTTTSHTSVTGMKIFQPRRMIWS